MSFANLDSKRVAALLCAAVIVAFAAWRVLGQSFGSFSHDQPFFGEDAAGGYEWPNDDAQSYTAGWALHGLQGGYNGWDGALPYVAATYTNTGWRLFYVDAYSEIAATNRATNADYGVSGTNYSYVITREVETGSETNWWTWLGVVRPYPPLAAVFYADAMAEYSESDYTNLLGQMLQAGTNWLYTSWDDETTTPAWTNLYTWHTRTNILNDVWFADAMDEYTNSQPVTNLVGGTNWIFTYTTNNYTSSTNGPNAWTNLYAAKDY